MHIHGGRRGIAKRSYKLHQPTNSKMNFYRPIYEIAPLHFAPRIVGRRHAGPRHMMARPCGGRGSGRAMGTIPRAKPMFWPAMWHCDSNDVFPAAAMRRNRFWRNNMEAATGHEVTDKTVNVNFPLDGFGKDDVEVKVEDSVLVITARKEEKNEKGEVVSSRKMSRAISLPENCDVDKLAKTVSEDGKVMAISVPRKVEAIEHEEVSEETTKTGDDNTVVLASIPVAGFTPDDVSVKIVDEGRMVVISGKHEEKSENGEVTSMRQFTNSFSLPTDIDKASIKSSVDGSVLKITANKTQEQITTGEKRSIPIEMETA